MYSFACDIFRTPQTIFRPTDLTNCWAETMAAMDREMDGWMEASGGGGVWCGAPSKIT